MQRRRTRTVSWRGLRPPACAAPRVLWAHSKKVTPGDTNTILRRNNNGDADINNDTNDTTNNVSARAHTHVRAHTHTRLSEHLG